MAVGGEGPGSQPGWTGKESPERFIQELGQGDFLEGVDTMPHWSAWLSPVGWLLCQVFHEYHLI